MKAGEIIKVGRKAKGMTQAQLAAEIGVSSAVIGKIEQCKTEASDTVLRAIARALDIKASELLEADEGKKTTSSTKKTTTKKKTSTTSAKSTNVRLTATEKKMLEAYRDATAKNRKYALCALQGAMTQDMLIRFIKDMDKDGFDLGDLAKLLIG